MMMRLMTLFILVAAPTLFAVAQYTNSGANWKVLSGLTYDKSEDQYGEIYVPKFSEDIKKLNGKTIVLEGYVVPFEGLFDPKKIIVSALPIASCFFCGGSGPETVAEVYLKDPVKYTAKPVRVTGRLELNSKDANQLMYILRDAKMEIL
jgi:hypothetical protein